MVLSCLKATKKVDEDSHFCPEIKDRMDLENLSILSS